MEFKYFKTKANERIITSDYIVGEEEYKRSNIKSASLPKINENEFITSLNENGKNIFTKIIEFAKSNSLVFVWGSKGFSLNVNINNENIALLFGYPPNSVFKQSIYTGFESILKKVNGSEDIVEYFKDELMKTDNFINAGINLKWIIDEKYGENIINNLLRIFSEVIRKIKEKY